MCFLTLNVFHVFFSVSIVDFEQVNVYWGTPSFDLDSGDFIADLKHIQHIIEKINFLSH